MARCLTSLGVTVHNGSTAKEILEGQDVMSLGAFWTSLPDARVAKGSNCKQSADQPADRQMVGMRHLLGTIDLPRAQSYDSGLMWALILDARSPTLVGKGPWLWWSQRLQRKEVQRRLAAELADCFCHVLHIVAGRGRRILQGAEKHVSVIYCSEE